MATKSPSTSLATGTKKQSVKPSQNPTGSTPLKPGEATPVVGPNTKKTSLKPGEAPPVDPNAPPPLPPQPAPPPVFQPWLRTICPPWEKAPKPPPPPPRWKPFNPKMLRKYKLPPQVEFQDAQWTRTMLDITMKKKYPKAVKMHVGPVKVTHEMHEGPLQVYLEPLAKKMPNYPECQKLQFSTNKPF
ncbi:unnamed protein product [Calypogeia fissa]